MFRTKWRIVAFGHERITLVPRGSVTRQEKQRALASDQASRRAESWFPGFERDEMLSRRKLFEIVETIDGHVFDGSRIPTRELLESVMRALRDGRLIAIEEPYHSALGGVTPTKSAEPASVDPPIEDLEKVTFHVRIHSLEEKLEGLRVEVELAGGVQVLTTDASGQVTIERKSGESVRVLSVNRHEGEKQK